MFNGVLLAAIMTTKLFVNENLIKTIKRILWKNKPAAKNKQYKYIWTMNGRIYVCQDTEFDAITVGCDKNLAKL